ncbi:protein NLP3-like isoform X2 [Zingiber officinale]|uniref:protein NLP3-like isoform X2 n=1 Tax=Zingiber officinale TaxID=94328 RepID=UPI001C4B68C2|nr:protein NLP3-like isoform X2 [Zingiber officinale]
MPAVDYQGPTLHTLLSVLPGYLDEWLTSKEPPPSVVASARFRRSSLLTMSDPSGHSSLPIMDLDLDGSPWPPFDQSSFAAIPLSPFLISSSPSLPPPFPTPLSLSIGQSSSSLWIVEERAAEVSSALAGDSAFFNDVADTIPAKGNGAKGNERQLQLPAKEEHVEASCVIKERMTQALRCFKESTDQHVLVQVWAPVKNGDRCVLTTSGQPFVLDPQTTKLLQYRTVSLMYIFSVDEGEDDSYLGLPGRVFTKRMPEWTPNVQYYSSKEYQRLNYALLYNIQGTLALPVFEPDGQSCIAVVELVMTSQKINYAYDVDKVCKALETVNLKSSEIMDVANAISNDGRQAALAEILEILTVVCEAQKLPLAQAWVPCRHRTILAQGGGVKKTCSSFDGSCMGQVCMSTTDVAFYIVDSHQWGFREACVEHHLQKGQGVAGRAFALRRPCFCGDVTKYCKSEYPLVHYARMFGLAGCLAICLRSIYSGDDDYILEFFLPAECKSSAEQQNMLKSISALLKQCFQNLKIITDMEFREAISLELGDLVTDDNYELQHGCLSSQHHDTGLYVLSENNIWETGENDKLSNDKNESPDLYEPSPTTDPNVKTDGDIISDSTLSAKKAIKTPGKRRGKAEKMIGLEVLQQYFSGSLKDAARSLGVCPTTMKRICRHYGISRWPSRKINKVNRSLSKLKHVIESVQGAGALDLTSLAGPLPATIDSIPWPVNTESLKDINEGMKGREFSPEKPYDRDDLQKKFVPLQINVDDAGPHQRPAKDYRCLKSGSSSDDSIDAPTSQGSCQGSPANEIFTSNQPDLDANQALDVDPSSKFILENTCNQNLFNQNSLPSPIIIEPQEPVEMLIKDSGSSKDLKNLCSFRGEASQDGCAMVLNDTASKNLALQENNTLTIKASYKDDIIRFRLPIDAGVVALKDEISKRFKLEVGIFDIKYLDDDHEWVMLACDSDLEECMDISRSSGASIIRLSVHDVITNLGSSCESSEFDHHIVATRHFNTG